VCLRARDHCVSQLELACLTLPDVRCPVWLLISQSNNMRTFDDFLQQGLMEYIDVNEENNGNCPLA